MNMKSIVGVEARNNTDIVMYNPDLKVKQNMSNKEAGHIVMFKDFDEKGNLKVESYAQNFLIKKEDIYKLTFKIIEVIGFPLEKKL